MLCALRLRRGAPTGLEVDDAHRALPRRLDPVDRAAQPGAADGDVERRLDEERLARLRDVGRELLDHALGPAPELARRPAVGQRELRPPAVELRAQLGERPGRVGLGDRVDERAEALVRRVGRRPAGRLERPPQRARRDRLDLRGRHRDGLLRTAQRRRARHARHAVPRLRAGLRDAERTEVRQERRRRDGALVRPRRSGAAGLARRGLDEDATGRGDQPAQVERRPDAHVPPLGGLDLPAPDVREPRADGCASDRRRTGTRRGTGGYRAGARRGCARAVLGTTPVGTVRAVGALGRRRRHDEVAEHRRRLLGVLHGRHDEATRRTRRRDDEGPQLVGEHLGARLRTDPVRVLGAAGEELDERLRAEQRVAQPEVGPHAVLDARHHDDVPLAPGRTGRGERRDGVGPARARRERVGGQVLRGEVLDERPGGRARHAVDERLRGAEQREHRVEVTVRARPGGAAVERRRAPALRETGRGPHRPQDRLRRRAGLRRRSPPRRERPRDRDRSATHRGRERRGARRVEEQLDEQRVGRAPAPALELLGPQRAAQTAQRDDVERAHGRREQRRRGERVEGLGVLRVGDAHAHGREERRDRRLVAQRDVGAEQRHGDRGGDELAAQRREPRPRARDDGHPVPGGAVQQVLRAQLAGDERGLLRDGREHRDLHGRDAGADVGRLARTPVGVPRRGATVHRSGDGADLRGHAAGHLAQRRALAPGGAQHGDARAQLAPARAVPPGRGGRPAHEPRARAAERLHRGVGVAEQHEARAVVVQHVQEARGRDRRLLVVVDDHEVPARPGGVGHLVVPGEQGLRGLVDDDRRVEPRPGVGRARAQGGDVEVLREELGAERPLRAVVALAEGGEVGRGQAALRRAHEEVAELLAQPPETERLLGQARGQRERGAEVREAAVEVALQELGEHEVLLRAGDQRGGGLAQRGRALAQDGEGRGRGGAHQRRADRAARAGRQAVTERGGGAARRGEEEHALGRDAVAQGREHDLLRDEGLARPGCAHHEGGPGAGRGGERRALGVVEHRVGLELARPRDEAGGGRRPGHGPDPITRHPHRRAPGVAWRRVVTGRASRWSGSPGPRWTAGPSPGRRRPARGSSRGRGRAHARPRG